MSEQEDLQKAIKESKARTQAKAVGEYLDKLIAEIDVCRARVSGSWLIYTVAWLSWVGSSFLHDPAADHTMIIVFICSIFYQSFRSARLNKAMGEFMGAVRILEILGLIPPLPQGGDRNKRRIWGEGVDMVKAWAAQKKEVQEKVYAPA